MMNIKITSMACVLLCAGVQAHAASGAACEPDELAEKYPDLAGRSITIGADPQTPPYVMRDPDDFDKIVGIDAELAAKTMDCIGLEYSFTLGGWSGLLPAVQAGQIDVMWDDLYYRPARAEVVDFVIYMQAATGALTPADAAGTLSGVEDLCGKTASFGLGSSNETAVTAQNDICLAEGAPAINMMPFQDLASGLRLIDSGRADVLMWDLGFVDNLVSNNSGKYARDFTIMDGYEIGAAVANGDDQLLNAIHEALTVLQSTGEEARILEAYGVSPDLELPAVIKTE